MGIPQQVDAQQSLVVLGVGGVEWGAMGDEDAIFDGDRVLRLADQRPNVGRNELNGIRCGHALADANGIGGVGVEWNRRHDGRLGHHGGRRGAVGWIEPSLQAFHDHKGDRCRHGQGHTLVSYLYIDDAIEHRLVGEGADVELFGKSGR